ncbi:phosphatidate cytidylyltransferase [Aliivibrio sp. 1S128]|uniref:phosphatidate cytidylyltransferase n=1 Tax=Aliivibrio sp. 1S128 TaxID=1840085 RepID=UPI00080E83B2|nr:phosphatidate cytidylyltransferase [Aliivibrio sp. 1S128]OCH23481.1 hypothetical protein A6E03_07430 [Aliivibrio sp. 1S128]
MSPNLIFMLIMFIFISVATVAAFIKKESLSSEFYLRVRSWWWMLFVLTLFVLLPISCMPLFILFLGLMGAQEIAKVSRLNALTTRALIISMTLPILLSYWSFYIMLITGVIGFTCALICLFISQNELVTGRNNKVAPLLSIMVLLAVFLFSFTLLLSHKESEVAMSYVLYLIFVTQFNDAIQYFVGKQFGKHQLCSTISPNKTVEGAIGGGLIVSVLATILALFITPFSLVSAIAMSFTLTTLGVSGDVCVSWVKRKFGVKDMGTLLPGHGGLLDRIDSLLLATPIFLLIVELLIL